MEEERRREWLEEWTGRTASGYACAEVVLEALTRVPEVIPALRELLHVYGAERVVRVRWTNGLDRATPWLEFYVVEMPSAWHAYGVYEHVPGGVDQSVLRGGPSKRVGGTVLIMKERWLAWDKPVGEEGRIGREGLRVTLSWLLPGVWALPEEVRRLAIMEPAPTKIEFVPRDALGLGIFGAALVARFEGPEGHVEMFTTYPRDFANASMEFEMVRMWLRGHEVIGVQVEHEASTDLFVPDERVGYVFVTLSSNGLRGVRGVRTVADAQALLARWE